MDEQKKVKIQYEYKKIKKYKRKQLIITFRKIDQYVKNENIRESIKILVDSKKIVK